MYRIVLDKYPTEKQFDLACDKVHDETVVLVYGDNSYICRTEKDIHEQWSVIQDMVEFKL